MEFEDKARGSLASRHRPEQQQQQLAPNPRCEGVRNPPGSGRESSPMLWLLLLLMSLLSNTFGRLVLLAVGALHPATRLQALLSNTFGRLVLLAVGALHPAYASCKAVRSRNPREYVRWMMYWIVLAGLLSVEPLADMMFACCLPLYAELKVLLVVWLQSPTTKGASLIFRKLVLPQFVLREHEIDAHLSKLKVRASRLGTTSAKYMTNVVMHSVFSHIRQNCSAGQNYWTCKVRVAAKTRPFDK
ncbi:secreted protein, putative [Ixodes scapularis]|uniref:Receptor expression-enhancing protein n=1 Tax=Ixodes scapularis TaxID=6945 RepID=B7PBG5_IXOSC|nr:secreted protein, putative [Ixodes scapularis]|eukprot:XP_002408126.1 secreted protein, putative [Ixodes scapularis]